MRQTKTVCLPVSVCVSVCVYVCVCVCNLYLYTYNFLPSCQSFPLSVYLCVCVCVCMFARTHARKHSTSSDNGHYKALLQHFKKQSSKTQVNASVNIESMSVCLCCSRENNVKVLINLVLTPSTYYSFLPLFLPSLLTFFFTRIYWPMAIENKSNKINKFTNIRWSN